jgi:hypothetical protein
MTTNLILVPAQAEAVYNAMQALIFVGGKLDVKLPNRPGNKSLRVLERTDGQIVVTITGSFRVNDEHESHFDQAAFARAYNIGPSSVAPAKVTPWQERHDPEGFKRGAPRTKEDAMAMEIAELREALKVSQQIF